MTDMVFTVDKVKELITLYNKARKTGMESFKFDGHELLTNYAYYLIQHLVSNLKFLKGTFDDNKIFTITKK